MTAPENEILGSFTWVADHIHAYLETDGAQGHLYRGPGNAAAHHPRPQVRQTPPHRTDLRPRPEPLPASRLQRRRSTPPGLGTSTSPTPDAVAAGRPERPHRHHHRRGEAQAVGRA